MKRKEYKLVIITDDANQPMAWDEGSKQLCYCTDDRWEDEHFPVRAYKAGEAKKLIAKAIRNRKRNRFDPGSYRTMPFTLNQSKPPLT